MPCIVVTGAAGALGTVVSRHLTRGGARVVALDTPHGAARLTDLASGPDAPAIALPLDVTRVTTFAAFEQSLRTVLHGWGRDTFDGLVNNGGYGLYKTVDAVTEEDFDGLYGVHLKGPFFLTQTLVPLLARGGQIVNVSSATTRVATVGVAPYASFKSALETLTQYLAKELGPRGIRANAVAPGAIRTELGGGLTPDFEALLAAQTALGRVGEPEDVARVIAALLGDDLGWVNGQCIDVSGGYCL